MKQISRLLSFAAAAAMCFSACSPEELKNGEVNVGKFVTVHFGTENTNPASTKATLTPNAGESAFEAAWENEDKISVKYSNDSESETATGTTTATWNGTSFESKMPEYTGMWIYDAAYPVPSESDSSVDFGPNRTQKGNAYNSKYDIMIGSAVAENAAAGKDETGKDIVFMMTRQTAIAYFHFTSDLNEAVTSATLTVSGEGAAIASNSAFVSDFAWAAYGDCQSITITFPEAAPNAQDFQLWFNVLPTNYASMTLTVETATKTFTISRSTIGEYVKGKLYKVKKSGVAWTDKAVTPGGPTITKITSASEFTAGTYIIMTYDETYYVPNAAATSAGPKLGNVVKTDGVITITPEMIWNATVSGGGLEFTSYVEPNNKLWGAPTNNGVRVNKNSTASNPSSVWKLESITNYGLCGYAGISGSDKYYLSTYSTTDWRNYKYSNSKFGADGNIPANFFKVEGWVDSNYSISIATVDGGTLSASPRSAAEGTVVTLTATPDKGYAFNNNWTVTNAETSEPITVENGTFTMPAANVNVTASFVMVPYLNVSASKTSIAAAGETVTITVDTNVDGWNATSDNAAFVVGTPTDNTVNVNVSKNTDASERKATITVRAGNLSETITLTQSAAGEVTVEKTSGLQASTTATKMDSYISYKNSAGNNYPDPMRIYKSNTFTISATNAVITKVEFTCDTKYKTTDGLTNGTVTVDNGATSNMSADGDVVTYTITGSTTSFKVTASDQFRVSGLKVTYKKVN